VPRLLRVRPLTTSMLLLNASRVLMSPLPYVFFGNGTSLSNLTLTSISMPRILRFYPSPTPRSSLKLPSALFTGPTKLDLSSRYSSIHHVIPSAIESSSLGFLQRCNPQYKGVCSFSRMCATRRIYFHETKPNILMLDRVEAEQHSHVPVALRGRQV